MISVIRAETVRYLTISVLFLHSISHYFRHRMMNVRAFLSLMIITGPILLRMVSGDIALLTYGQDLTFYSGGSYV